MLENTIKLIRMLKGAPISILWALMVAGQPVGCEWLGRITGYTDKPVQQGMLLLEEYGLVIHVSRYTWTLANGAKQLPLMGELISERDDKSTRNNSESIDSTTTATAAMEENRLDGSSSSKRTRNYSESLEALRDAGIGEPMASKLAKLPHVNEHFIRAHTRKAHEDQISTGLLVHRIRYNDPEPETKARDSKEDRRRYYDGEFGDFIEH